VNEIMHAVGYVSGAIGISFAIAFGLYAGVMAAAWCFGPIRTSKNTTEHHYHHTTPVRDIPEPTL
jgi:hypothetical protein